MPDRPPADHINRRSLFMSAGLLGLLGLQEALADGHTSPRRTLSEAQQAALERANDKLVADFVAAYSTRDASVLDKFVTDDIVYQITEGRPEIVGREAFFKHNDDMLQGLEKVEWVNLRQCAIGQIVLNDRIDEFYPYPGSKVPRMRFRVAGFFLIDDGRIKVWRDYSYPGSKSLIEPAPKA